MKNSAEKNKKRLIKEILNCDSLYNNEELNKMAYEELRSAHRSCLISLITKYKKVILNE
jgi:hypothetical protein